MANPNPPYFVHFLADEASTARIDHSQAAPRKGAHRAGHTSINFRGQGALTWQPETGRLGRMGSCRSFSARSTFTFGLLITSSRSHRHMPLARARTTLRCSMSGRPRKRGYAVS